MEHLGGMDVGESMFMLILTNGTSAKANISWTNMLENPNMCRCKFTGVKNRIHQSWNHYKLSLYHMYFPKVNISKPILHKYLWQFGTSVCVHLFFWRGAGGEEWWLPHKTSCGHFPSSMTPRDIWRVGGTLGSRFQFQELHRLDDGTGRDDQFWGCFSKNTTEF